MIAARCPACKRGFGPDVPDGEGCVCGQLWSWGAHPTFEEWRLIRSLLAGRSQQHCERCGVYLDGRTMATTATVHHRNPRGMGGTTDPAINHLCNMVLLCGGKLGGVVGCHGDTESDRAVAVETGWLVPMGVDPAQVPIVLASGRRVLLLTDVPEYARPADGVEYFLHRKAS